MKPNKYSIFEATLLGLALAAGCTPEEPPYVAFLSPLDGDTVCGDPFDTEVDLRGFELVDEVITDPESLPAGKGHTHFYLNGQYVHEGADPVTSFEDPVEDGVWQLKVELANANHAPVEPYVYDLIYVTVDNTLCD